MPVHNFMLDDLRGALAAIALFPAFLLIPGYVTAWTFLIFAAVPLPSGSP
jgi:hypothetical protein